MGVDLLFLQCNCEEHLNCEEKSSNLSHKSDRTVNMCLFVMIEMTVIERIGEAEIMSFVMTVIERIGEVEISVLRLALVP